MEVQHIKPILNKYWHMQQRYNVLQNGNSRIYTTEIKVLRNIIEKPEWVE